MLFITLFNFVIDAIMKECLKGNANSGIELFPGSRLLDYADDMVLLFETQSSAQEMLDKISAIIPSFGMRFAPSKCKVLLQDIPGLGSPLLIDDKELEIVDRFTYLGSCVSSDCSLNAEIDARIAKARGVFHNLRHLWCQKGVSQRLKGRVYSTTVRAVGCETWTWRAEDIRRLQVFDNRRLRSMSGVGWFQRVSNRSVLERLLGKDADLEKTSISIQAEVAWSCFTYV